MISPIYGVWNKGQAVTVACHWLLQHRSLAFRIMLLPDIIVTLAILVLYITDNEELLFLITVFYAFLAVVQPMLMFEIVENHDEYHYPEHTNGIMRVYRRWWHYFLPILKVTFVSFFVYLVLSLTFIGAFLVPFVQLLAIVICQRQEDKGVLSALTDAVKMVFGAIGTFIISVLSSGIIIGCTIGIPIFMFFAAQEVLKHYLSSDVYRYIVSLFPGEVSSYILILIYFTSIVSYQIIYVILNYFYGHCMEKKEHPALVDRMERFS